MKKKRKLIFGCDKCELDYAHTHCFLCGKTYEHKHCYLCGKIIVDVMHQVGRNYYHISCAIKKRLIKTWKGEENDGK